MCNRTQPQGKMGGRERRRSLPPVFPRGVGTTTSRLGVGMATRRLYTAVKDIQTHNLRKGYVVKSFW